jgi:uncharacterized protein YcbX
MTPAVSSLHVYPVKGCRAVDLDRAVVGPYGLVGDREWQVIDEDGRFLTQRRHPQLVRVAPALAECGIRLRAEGHADLEVVRPRVADRRAQTFSGEVQVGDAGDAAAAWLQRVVGVPCRLTAIAPGYSRRLPEAFDVFGQEVSLSDAAPVLVASDSSHRFLVERAAEPFGIDRFRPNVVVRGSAPWEEDTWHVFTVGGSTMRAGLPWPRCTVPQVDQRTGERHREPAVVLKEHRWCAEAPELSDAVQALVCGNALFGVGCSAAPEGAVVAVGDRVDVLERGDPVLAAPLVDRTPLG